MPKYSIVVPLHNEQENVTDLYDREDEIGLAWDDPAVGIQWPQLSDVTPHWRVVFGPLLVAVAVFLPGGLAGIAQKITRGLRGE